MKAVCSSQVLASIYKSTWRFNQNTNIYIFTVVITSGLIKQMSVCIVALLLVIRCVNIIFVHTVKLRQEKLMPTA
jgi:hypothetical protein